MRVIRNIPMFYTEKYGRIIAGMYRFVRITCVFLDFLWGGWRKCGKIPCAVPIYFRSHRLFGIHRSPLAIPRKIA